MRLRMADGELIYNEQSKLLVEANRAVELLQQHPYADRDPYISSLYMKATIHEKTASGRGLCCSGTSGVDYECQGPSMGPASW